MLKRDKRGEREGWKERKRREKMTVNDVLEGSFSNRHTKAAFQNNRSHMISRAKQTGTLREQDEVTCKKVTWLTPSSPSQIDHTLQFCIILFSLWSLLIILDEPFSTKKSNFGFKLLMSILRIKRIVHPRIVFAYPHLCNFKRLGIYAWVQYTSII